MDPNDRVTAKALLRYQIISAYLAVDPPRGQRGQMLQKLASRTWLLENGEVYRVKAETIRYWLRRYRQQGFEALKDKARKCGRQPTIPAAIVEKACCLKREVPERSIERIITIMENMQMAPPGLLRRSTLHRALKKRGLSTRGLKICDNKDLERFEADYANDLWQSDMLQGPWLPDPKRPGKMRRCYLYAFLDDASRLLLYGRFFFKGDLPALELVFKRALQRYGRPQRVYYDNAKVYRANHMRLICAELGIHRPVYTQVYRPMGHGKIEAFNRFCVTNFIAEVKASAISTVNQLNQAFLAWLEAEYNTRRHSSLGISPKQRWLKDAHRIHYLDEEKLRVAFLWREQRRADKTGVISLFNNKYKVAPGLAKKKIQVRYDPESLEQIEIYIDGRFRQRAKRLKITAHRGPKQISEQTEDKMPATDYLGWLTHSVKQKDAIDKPSNMMTKGAFLKILKNRIAAEVFDADLAGQFYNTYGPFDSSRLHDAIDTLLGAHPANLHLSFYLTHIKDRLIGE